MRTWIAALTAGALGGALSPAQAERFENTYIAFNMPDGWECKREQTEFVCRPPNPSGKGYEAIMILTAKEAGPQDTLTAYRAHLDKKPADPQASIVKPAAMVDIQGTAWVDATLLGSEIPRYHTRYMATVKDGIAVLYTFSVHQSVYEKYAGAFTLAVQTLKVKARGKKSKSS